MLTTCVYITVKPEKIDSFILATIENHIESVKEPGNLRFDFLQQADDPCKFMLYEAYESEAAASAHKNTSHYNKWRNTVTDYMAEPRTGIKYKIIEPGKNTKW
jgi:(4S)-4-hydroxy-5-phosphonooxypentane-2,3-dione isomerase